MDNIEFAVKGLPYISKNFKGDHYYATRDKVTKWIENEFKCGKENMKFLFVNMDTGDIKFSIARNTKTNELETILKTSPAGEIRFSWEKCLRDNKRENSYLLKYRANIYLTSMYTCYKDLEKNRDNMMALYQNHDSKLIDDFIEQEYFECEMEKFLIQNEIDEILSSRGGENVDVCLLDIIISNPPYQRTKKRTRTISNEESRKRAT